jgi:DNA-directed RNA polymerase specialized sigma24 family protein
MRDYTAATDDELLILARDDADAFAAFYDRYARAVASWLARRAHPDLAQDLVAETLAQAW